MKINGRKIHGANFEYVVIPRTGQPDIVFKCQAVLDTKEFDRLCPEPKPPMGMVPGGEPKPILDDKNYIEARKNRGSRKYQFTILKSLEATEGLEWDTVKMEDPSTWDNWEAELTAAGFTERERFNIQLGVATANSLNQDKLDEARERFLASLEATASPSSSQLVAQ